MTSKPEEHSLVWRERKEKSLGLLFTSISRTRSFAISAFRAFPSPLASPLASPLLSLLQDPSRTPPTPLNHSQSLAYLPTRPPTHTHLPTPSTHHLYPSLLPFPRLLPVVPQSLTPLTTFRLIPVASPPYPPLPSPPLYTGLILPNFFDFRKY